jgi:hypothetical protein
MSNDSVTATAENVLLRQRIEDLLETQATLLATVDKCTCNHVSNSCDEPLYSKFIVFDIEHESTGGMKDETKLVRLTKLLTQNTRNAVYQTVLSSFDRSTFAFMLAIRVCEHIPCDSVCIISRFMSTLPKQLQTTLVYTKHTSEHGESCQDMFVYRFSKPSTVECLGKLSKEKIDSTTLLVIDGFAFDERVLKVDGCNIAVIN